MNSLKNKDTYPKTATLNPSEKSSGLSTKKLPPHSMEAERSILAAMMLESDAVYIALENVSLSDFYDKSHRYIFTAIVDLFNKNDPIDLVTVSEGLRKNNQLYEVGDVAYLSALVTQLPTAANIKQHAQIVRNNALLRRLISTCTEIIQDSYETEDIQSLIDRAEAKIFDIATSKKTSSWVLLKDQIHKTFDAITKIYENRGEICGLSTGFRDLDELTSGLTPSELVVVAARPSMGKTAFATMIMEHVSLQQKKTVLFFSLEMSKESLVQRILCSYAGVNAHSLKKGSLNDKGWVSLTDAAEKLSKSNVFIDDTPGLNILEMKTKARRLQSQKGLDLIVIDYMQLMQGYKKTESRQQEISEISRSLKDLARELKLPIIALSQLSRAVEGRNNKTPLLSDLRESGAIEQDADVVLMLMREEYYNPTEENKNIAQVIVGKNRNGPTGKIDLIFRKEIIRFENRSHRKSE